MTPDPVDAALDVWWDDHDWRAEEEYDPGSIEKTRARMRRVLAAHDAMVRPSHTDLMVSPESIDAFLEANPPPEPDPDTLPMEALPEGWGFNGLSPFHNVDFLVEYECILSAETSPFVDVTAYGPTPRAAMLAAIETAKEGGKDGP